MSDDEEILCEGNELYAYLIDHGYSDFQTFDPRPDGFNRLSVSDINLTDFIKKKNVGDEDYTLNLSFDISSHNHKQVLILINSRLMFQEDLNLIESLMYESVVYKNKSKVLWYTGATCGVILFSLGLHVLRQNTNIYLPSGFTALFSIYCLWKGYKESVADRETNLLLEHVRTQQMTCSVVHKLLRYLKETEILSGNQASVGSFGANLYFPLFKSQINECNNFNYWKTLPHLRQCLFESLVSVIDILLSLCQRIKQICKYFIPENSDNFIKDSLQSVFAQIENDQEISIKTLQILIDIYLTLQSECLRRIALAMLPIFWENHHSKQKASKQIFKLLCVEQTKLTDLCYKLTLQYKIHSLSLLNRPKKMFLCDSMKNLKDSKELGLSEKQVEVHNIFLLMLSVLLRVRNVEEYLEEISSSFENLSTDNLNANLSKQLMTLRDDFTCALKCFDMIYSSLSPKQSIHCESNLLNNDTITQSSDSKTTGICVGKSDFSVNSPDEVFLAISGLKSEENQDCIDDCLMEKTPIIPKSLLKELSSTLKDRKKHFLERERIALERQGLQDLDSETDDGSDCSEPSCKQKTRYFKKGLRKSIHDQTRPVYRKLLSESSVDKIDLLNSNSENSSLTDDEDSKSTFNSEVTFLSSTGMNCSSLANIIATQSQKWGVSTEDYYSDDLGE